jgi:hypothetical protein
MKHTSSLHNITYGRNLYAGEPPALLRAEAECLTDNRRLIEADLKRDPASWVGGRANVNVLNVLLGNALAVMLHHPSMIVGVAL